MSIQYPRRRKIAVILLLVWAFQILMPQLSYALTSGPAQPESKGFDVMGTENMVDLFTGDFNYSIPLLDVDGYPVSLSYQSGSGMDDEASWVGLGWTLNTGAITRQLRGLPDDISGDEIITEFDIKPKVTVGGKVNVKTELFGNQKLIGGNLSFTLGVFNDNYNGVGAEIGANAGLSSSFTSDSKLTASLGLGITSSTASGVDVSPSLSLSINNEKTTNTTSSSISGGFNSRSGIKDITLSGNLKNGAISLDSKLGGITYNVDPVYPKIDIPFASNFGSFSINVGAGEGGFYAGGGGTGYMSVRRISNRITRNPGFGFLYADRAKKVAKAVMDFTREKDGAVSPETPAIAIPIPGQDIFNFTSSVGAGQFKLYRGGTGVFGDNEVIEKSNSTTAGAEFSVNFSHFGVSLYNQNNTIKSSVWRKDNIYANLADFQDFDYSNPNKEPVYFKVSGEKSKLRNQVAYQNRDAQSVRLSGKRTLASFSNNGINTNASFQINSPINQQNREVKNTTIDYFTAYELNNWETIRNFNFNDSITNFINTSTFQQTNRINTYRKKDHISKIVVNNESGQRLVYGHPVYNKVQEEYTFAIGKNGTNYTETINGQNLINIDYLNGNINHKKGIDNYFRKEVQPAYAHSFMLTQILSPDYIDRTGNGISNDDLGTAWKFNYSMVDSYKWRSPYGNKAIINKGLIADEDDDKASFVYGEKELAYVHSIETKTRVAYFITSDRYDGLGVTGATGLMDQQNKQKKLKEIRLYSKGNDGELSLLKRVVFEYDYSLCPGVPNQMVSGLGKLTLKKVYFTFANSTKGKYHPYIFTYKNNLDNGIGIVNYQTNATDRWGNFKGINTNGIFRNEDFPYTEQNDRTKSDDRAGLWQISKIELPTGGIINLAFEADDYAFVQDKKAMHMVKPEAIVNRIGQDISATQLLDAKGMRLNIPAPNGLTGEALKKWFIREYLEGSEYLYTKSFLDLGREAFYSSSTVDDFDWVASYVKIKEVLPLSSNGIAVIFEDISNGRVTKNPIIFAGWQKIKNEYPRFGYPGFVNRLSDGSVDKAIAAAVKAIISSVQSLGELKRNFYEKSQARNFCGTINLDKSFVRLVKSDGKKIGGGSRVQQITFSDEWDKMGTESNAAIYGQKYTYLTVNNGQIISSGVAASEPFIGGDESPLKQPIPYLQKIKGAVDNFYNIDAPFGETLYPGASVGYSKVTVTDLVQGVLNTVSENGYVTNEFYTAKDFPVISKILPLIKKESKPKSFYSSLGGDAIHEQILSQGFMIELNDMHGKMKSMTTYNKGGQEVSSEEYIYQTESFQGQKRLNNTVNTVYKNANIINSEILGRETEFYVDARESENSNIGNSIQFGLDRVWIFPIPHLPSFGNSEIKLFRSISATKIIQSYGVLEKVIKRQSGSQITTQNMLYDGLTGNLVVSKTQNEFNNNTYQTSIPAYWAYESMGGAYKNNGIVIKNLVVDVYGNIPNFSNYLHEGDELQSPSDFNTYWVIKGQDSNLHLIDRNGTYQSNKSFPYIKLIRSGYRNMLSLITSSYVSLENPVENNSFKFLTASEETGRKIINSQTMIYDDNWAGIPEGYQPEKVINNSAVFTFCKGMPGAGYYGSNGARYFAVPLIDWAYINPSAAFGGLYYSCSQNNNTMSTQSTNSSGGIQTNVATSYVSYNYACQRDNIEHPLPQHSCWPIYRAGFSIDENVSSNNLNRFFGFEKRILIPHDKDYFFGFAADDQIQVFIDNQLIIDSDFITPTNNNFWTIIKHSLTKGPHRLKVQYKNKGTGGTNLSNPAIAALEIYNSLDYNSNDPALDLFFSTAEIVGQNIQSFRETTPGNFIYHWTLPDGSNYDVMNPQLSRFNPYAAGFKGNWRLKENAIYEKKRVYGENIFNNSNGGLKIAESGYIDKFYSYWKINNGSLTRNNLVTNYWKTTNTVTLYNTNGQEIENRNINNQYSAATFELGGELPSAVASNAYNREIYFNSFEDYRLKVHDSSNEFIATDEYLVNNSDFSHTGFNSLYLPYGGIQMRFVTHSNTQPFTDGFLTFNENGEYSPKKGDGIYSKGFEPLPNTPYIIGLWFKDDQPLSKANNKLVVTVSGRPVVFTTKAIIEGWKYVEGKFQIVSSNSSNPSLISISSLNNQGAIFIDDLRIFPEKANMNSYVYHDKTLKLMATIDENGFSTLYEYDDEQQLIRVKKETEKGIVTLKENRSSYVKKQ